ncbi:MAG: glycine reductase [Firmicutes bacterium]|nr:glycine reductase [Bacillota bacterium]
MNYPVIKGASYALIHAVNLLINQGTTQTLEREKDPDSEYLKNLPRHLRSFEQVVNYAPSQAYIGNMRPDNLRDVAKPWYEHPVNGSAQGRYGEIMAEDIFYGLLKLADAFDLVMLETGFTARVKKQIAAHPLFGEDSLAALKEGENADDIRKRVEEYGAEGLYYDGELVGCVKRAHDRDPNLNAHIMLENLVVKASGILALKHLLDKTGVAANEIDYIIEASEEACGDMNQRGGGNFAKAIGEIAGCSNATGCDVRGFCAAPAHALLTAAALVQAGVFKNVAVVAGGATAKLGMNGKDHVAKDMPVLEDVLGAFGVLISANDGESPVFRTDVVGRHNIGRGSSPQAVIQAIVTDPLDKVDLRITDVDKYSVEMQNPEVTVPAGAGDVPAANYKMIGALGVKRGDLERSALPAFVEQHGMPGFAPTQGHIPSGVPFVGHARDMILAGDIQRAMIVGKGSLFLARMTNQFDGVSFVMEANSGKSAETTDIGAVKQVVAQAMRDVAERLINPN